MLSEQESKKRASDAELESERPEKRHRSDEEASDAILESALEELDESERARQDMHDWIMQCDTPLLELYGEPVRYGGHAVLHDYVRRNCTGGKARAYYDEAPEQRETDAALCNGVCSVETLHTLAALWQQRSDGAAELLLLFHVLRHHLGLLDTLRRARILARLMELGVAHRTHRATTRPLRETPPFAYNLLAALYYTNVDLVVARGVEWRPACTDCRSDRYGFSDLVRASLFPDEPPFCAHGDALQPVANQARDAIVSVFDKVLRLRDVDQLTSEHAPASRPLYIALDVRPVYTWIQ